MTRGQLFATRTSQLAHHPVFWNFPTSMSSPDEDSDAAFHKLQKQKEETSFYILWTNQPEAQRSRGTLPRSQSVRGCASVRSKAPGSGARPLPSSGRWGYTVSVCPLGASSLWGFRTHHIVKYDIKLSLSLVRAFERVFALKQANKQQKASPAKIW